MDINSGKVEVEVAALHLGEDGEGKEKIGYSHHFNLEIFIVKDQDPGDQDHNTHLTGLVPLVATIPDNRIITMKTRRADIKTYTQKMKKLITSEAVILQWTGLNSQGLC